MTDDKKHKNNVEFSKIYLATKYAEVRLKLVAKELRQDVKQATNQAHKSSLRATSKYEKHFNNEAKEAVKEDLILIDEILTAFEQAERKGLAAKLGLRNYLYTALQKFK